MVKRSRDVSLKISLAKRSCRRLALHDPLLTVTYKNTGPMKSSKHIPRKSASYVVLAVVFLNVL